MAMRKILNPITLGNSILNFCYLYLCYTRIKDLFVLYHGDKLILTIVYTAFILTYLFICIYLFLKVSMGVIRNEYANLFLYQLIASFLTLIIFTFIMYVIFNENTLSFYRAYALIISFIITSYLIYSIIFLRYAANKKA